MATPRVCAAYRTVINYFLKAHKVLLTATPFRGDGKKLRAEEVHRTSISECIRNGFIKVLLICLLQASPASGCRREHAGLNRQWAATHPHQLRERPARLFQWQRKCHRAAANIVNIPWLPQTRVQDVAYCPVPVREYALQNENTGQEVARVTRWDDVEKGWFPDLLGGPRAFTGGIVGFLKDQ